jgi:CMP-N,N'-diacetyllegionaminic acid synthase
MIAGKSVLAIIPARGGSKGVPRKNIRDMAGKPLIAWTIEEARKSQYIDRLIVSSEDTEIINVARKWGCEVPFTRPAELARDETPGIEPVIHALTVLPRYNYVVLLQATSPFRSVEDIDGCIEQCIRQDAAACVSITESDKSPYWMYTLDTTHHMEPLISNLGDNVRRQDLPQIFSLNGAVYVAKVSELLRSRSFITPGTVGYRMPKDRSLDIDTEQDFRICEILMRMGTGNRE